MNAITISANGHVTFSKALLRHLRVRPGDKISLDRFPNGELRVRTVRPVGKIDGFFGSLKREGQRPNSIEEMDEAIAKGWVDEP
ncbi:ribose-phosphate pyrophosphokinase-like domain-containing protein [Sphingomonas sp. MG17]|uniref:Ribose-phosphate pyrophosphokinase-like domain-containing protein n=1 Tax=Sphingomonas tagetis TaxID=2949092 RepID=A0A9X2HNU1_9SPHN|nr:ribose-phosphate pyrophosphokinase-like domain-containing protein [Sphingomonas tagetis]MCP3732704.1 ribose-phosphate pyrophosphokinase-like domain-containing protein [Sphingomonas tagetis]